MKLALVIGLSLSFAAVITPPASAADKSSASTNAQKAASIDELKATDADLLKAIGELSAAVDAQKAELASAQQAFDAATATVNASNAQSSQTEQQVQALRALQAQRALEAYMSPTDDMVTAILSANGMADASRRSELLRELSTKGSDNLDALHAATRELDDQRKAAVNAQKIADKRRGDAQKKLDELNASLAEKAKLDQSLKQRISAAAAEDDAAAKRKAAIDAANSAASRASRDQGASVDDSRVSAAGLQWPIHGKHQINSPFGPRWGRMHEGVDIQASVGTPIYAAKSGTVSYAGWEDGYGNYTCIQHGGGFETCYAHQTKIMVKVGQQVGAGDQIGTAGNTGASEGAHLHFETCISNGPECFYGTYKNPMNYLP